jgi:hypothetical protein
LHGKQQGSDDTLEGAFLGRVDRVLYHWHPARPFYVLRFAIHKSLAADRNQLLFEFRFTILHQLAFTTSASKGVVQPAE